MPTPRLAIFDDDQGIFGPLADLRAPFEFRTGAQTTMERIERIAGAKAAAIVPAAYLEPLIRQRYPTLSIGAIPPESGHWIWVNSRCAAPAALARVVELEPDQMLCDPDGRVVGAHLHWRGAGDFLGGGFPAQGRPVGLQQPVLLSRPWHILDQFDATLRDDLAGIDFPGSPGADEASGLKFEIRDSNSEISSPLITGGYPVKISPSAKLHPFVVLNAADGPIAIGHHAVVSSFALITGPCSIGHHTTVAPHAHIRGSSIGPTCVVGGEVAGSIIQGLSNKAHAGYLGNAIVGQWVNLGADTNASNLKNTYGNVRMRLAPDGAPENSGGSGASGGEDSGRDKLGPVIGDFVRTGIGTRSPTGCCIGTGAMVALSTFAPKYVPAMSFLTDQGAERADVEKFLATVRKMMARRNQSLGPAEEGRLRQLVLRG